VQDELCPHPNVFEVHEQVPGLLHYPRLDRMLGGSEDPDAAGVTVPWLNVALARHPAFGRSISTLRDCGITVILDLAHLPDDNPGQAKFPWD
jgi:hypothetical protein